jgi:hypothetical protein
MEFWYRTPIRVEPESASEVRWNDSVFGISGPGPVRAISGGAQVLGDQRS